MFKMLANSCQLLGGVILAISYIPAIKMIYKNKSTKNQSILFWVILVIGLSLFEINAIYLTFQGVVTYFISQTLNLLFASIILIQLLYYKKGGK